MISLKKVPLFQEERLPSINILAIRFIGKVNKGKKVPRLCLKFGCQIGTFWDQNNS